jgi:hypothetical protein
LSPIRDVRHLPLEAVLGETIRRCVYFLPQAYLHQAVFWHVDRKIKLAQIRYRQQGNPGQCRFAYVDHALRHRARHRRTEGQALELRLVQPELCLHQGQVRLGHSHFLRGRSG